MTAQFSGTAASNASSACGCDDLRKRGRSGEIQHQLDFMRSESIELDLVDRHREGVSLNPSRRGNVTRDFREGETPAFEVAL
jgi:hypothetical protein